MDLCGGIITKLFECMMNINRRDAANDAGSIKRNNQLDKKNTECLNCW